MNILVVDDSHASARLLELALSDRWRVLVAHDAARALAIAAEQIVDLVILDMQLPDMHGSALASELKANPRTRGIPLLAVSGTLEEIDRAREAGCEAFMIKPLSAAAIRQKVALLLREAYQY
jgi:CheY-like chemotaxis protein